MANKKPALKDVLEIFRMKKEAVALYDEIDIRVQKICSQFREGRFDYDLGKADEDGKQYLKFEIVDNVLKMMKNETVWKSIALKPVSFSVGMLKRRPESLK